MKNRRKMRHHESAGVGEQPVGIDTAKQFKVAWVWTETNTLSHVYVCIIQPSTFSYCS
jgi:hypothetical protein